MASITYHAHNWGNEAGKCFLEIELTGGRAIQFTVSDTEIVIHGQALLTVTKQQANQVNLAIAGRLKEVRDDSLTDNMGDED